MGIPFRNIHACRLNLKELQHAYLKTKQKFKVLLKLFVSTIKLSPKQFHLEILYIRNIKIVRHINCPTPIIVQNDLSLNISNRNQDLQLWIHLYLKSRNAH